MVTLAVTGTEFGERLVSSDQKLVATPRLTYDMCDSWPIRGVYVGRFVGIFWSAIAGIRPEVRGNTAFDV